VDHRRSFLESQGGRVIQEFRADGLGLGGVVRGEASSLLGCNVDPVIELWELDGLGYIDSFQGESETS
jgi:hypothetical protein